MNCLDMNKCYEVTHAEDEEEVSTWSYQPNKQVKRIAVRIKRTELENSTAVHRSCD